MGSALLEVPGRLRPVLAAEQKAAAIRAGDGILTLATMRFADEVVPATQLEGLLGEKPDTPPRKQEIEMAKQLISSLSTDFEPVVSCGQETAGVSQPSARAP